MSDPPSVAASRRTLRARALLLGQRLDVRALGKEPHVALGPLARAAGRSGHAVIFRYGAAVFFGLDDEEERAAVRELQPHVTHPLDEAEVESVTVEIDPERPERLEPDETLVLHGADVERLQVVADVLAKSVALAHFEARMAGVFESIEPVAGQLRGHGRAGAPGHELLRHIGDVLLMQHRMVGRVEVIDKPELVWDRPELDRLYTRLQDEYELVERHRVLDRKLDLIGRTVQTVVDLEQDKRTHRVEWYIVILIVVEIVILLYDVSHRLSHR